MAFQVVFNPDEDTKELLRKLKSMDSRENMHTLPLPKYPITWTHVTFDTREDAETAIIKANPNPKRRHEYYIIEVDD